MIETVFNLDAIFVRAHIYLKGAQKHVTHTTHTNQTFISRATKTLVSKLSLKMVQPTQRQMKFGSIFQLLV